MKKFRLVAILLVGIMAIPFIGCSSGESVEIDETKTQIYIDHYNGGVGDAWFEPLKTRFEEEYKDYKLGDKTGVQLILSNHKNEGTQIMDTLTSSSMDVYFSDTFYYYEGLAKNCFLDISEVVESVNSDGKTIKSKFTPEQEAYYNYNGKYYALPHYSFYGGLPYNIDVFEDNLLYFSNNKTVNGGFITSLTSTRSLGPDGKTGVIDGIDYSLDDGLPATYDEFFKLCDRMVACDVIPFTWSGQYGKAYFNAFLESLAISYEGKEQTMLNFTFNGTATNLVKSIDNNGNVVFDDPTSITEENGYKIYQSAGRYYALKFIEKIFSNRDYYDFDNVNNGADSHTDAQTRFVLNSYDPSKKPIAFLVDGTYWEKEAEGVGAFATLKNLYNINRDDVKFGFMPIPKVDETHIGEKNVLIESSNTLAFINSNVQTRCPEKIEILKEFLKFAYTDESLKEFTIKTLSPKGLNYTFSAEEKAQMPNFLRSVIDLKERCDMVYPYGANEKFIRNQQTLTFKAIFKTDNYQFAMNAIKDGVSAKDYFGQIKTTYDSSFWSVI